MKRCPKKWVGVRSVARSNLEMGVPKPSLDRYPSPIKRGHTLWSGELSKRVFRSSSHTMAIPRKQTKNSLTGITSSTYRIFHW